MHQPTPRPNVILIMTDDQGYGDLGCHGNPHLKTPNLDKLYADSVRCTDFHVDPMCSPTRAALMTGRYAARTGVWSTLNGCYIARREEVTMGHVFADAGYGTAMFGKWHLGDSYPYSPEHRGFQHVVRHNAGVVGEVPDHWNNSYFDDTYLRNGVWEKFDGYCTDIWFDETMDYIRSRDGQPFFCYLATNAPHSPFNVHERYSQPYVDAGVPEERARFYGMIASIDENMGRLTEFLRREGLEENTMVIFLGDNGTSGGVNVTWPDGFTTDGYNAGMRGKKTMPYEGGHRNACFIRWPAGGVDGGRDVGGLSAHFDLLPTLADLCGIPFPDSQLDGVSLAKQIRGEETQCPDRTLVAHNMQLVEPRKYKDYCVMFGRWRLVSRGLSQEVELFDLDADPGQRTDVAGQHADLTKKLMAGYEQWWEDMTPSFNHVSELVIGSEHENPVMLTCHSWRTTSEEWSYDQIHVREGVVIDDAYWPIEVARDGMYRIEVCRWPREAGVPLTQGVPAKTEPFCDPKPEGKAYRISHARLAVQDFDDTVSVKPDDLGAVFELPLNAGQTRLGAAFHLEDGSTLGAYYVYVTRTGPSPDHGNPSPA